MSFVLWSLCYSAVAEEIVFSFFGKKSGQLTFEECRGPLVHIMKNALRTYHLGQGTKDLKMKQFGGWCGIYY